VRAPRPYNLVAELTYRCPLRCPYCSNPLDHATRREALDADAWARVFREAAGLGVVHVGLTGGEPSARPDLEAIVRGAAGAGLFVHLVTAGRPLAPDDLPGLVAAGLRSVQLSVQDADPDASDRYAGTACHAEKRELARAVRALGLPLLLNVVLHRENLPRLPAILEMARELDADRLELAHVQYHGWALRNRDALLPSRAQIDEARALVARARAAGGRPEVLHVLPDYFAERPKPCMGGWGRRTIVVTPEGVVQPCHAAGSLPGIELWSVLEHSLAACWSEAPGMRAFRGEDWMQEPCRSCPQRAEDYGGCRCQAFQLTGDPRATDPACALSPRHELVVRAREAAGDAGLVYRGARGGDAA